MATTGHFTIDFDGSVELKVVLMEPLDFMSHPRHQPDQPLVLMERA
jgi:hypothetical protein